MNMNEKLLYRAIAISLLIVFLIMILFEIACIYLSITDDSTKVISIQLDLIVTWFYWLIVSTAFLLVKSIRAKDKE